MKYLISLFTLLALGWFSYGVYNSVPGDGLYDLKAKVFNLSTVETVTDGVDALIGQLDDIDAQIQAGELDDEAAYKLKASIDAKAKALNEYINSAEASSLSAVEKRQVSELLQKIKNTLLTYQDVMIELEKKAARSKRSRGGSATSDDAGESTTDVIEEVADSLSDYIEAVEEVTEITDESFLDINIEDNATGTEETSDESDSTLPDDPTDAEPEEEDSQDDTTDPDTSTTTDPVVS